MHKILLTVLILTGLSQADIKSNTEKSLLTAEIQGSEGNKEKEIDALIKKFGAIGYSTVSVNKNIQTHYYNKYAEKNVEMLSFISVLNKEKLRPLLLANPDFGAYAPFNFLVYKTLDIQEDNNTWYGHLSTDIMLEIIGEKDEGNRKAFIQMIDDFDALVKTEMKPNLSKKFEHTKPLPKNGLLKFVKTFEKTDDIEDFVDEFIMDYDGRFAKREFIIAGFVDLKFEFDDMDLEFDAYDAFWVSQLCHFEFSNSIFNRGMPEAGMFAPCSIYFYIPAGTNELHVGYASVENWVNALNFKDQKRIDYMRKIDAEVSELLINMGFSAVKKEVEVPTAKPSTVIEANTSATNISLLNENAELKTLKKELVRIKTELEGLIQSIK